MLELRNIRKIYKNNGVVQDVLKDINVNFRKHEFVSILGPSGSGKTTLLNIIGGLDKYTSGDLIINGKHTKKFTDKLWDSYRNNHVGFIFQNYNLIDHISVYKNVELALTISGIKSKKKRVINVLKKVGLEKYAYKKPKNLSGGQMQRVAIARALVNDPDIILADEPTGALDTKTSIEIMKLIKKVSKEKLVIMVTHNVNLANKYSDRIIKLQDGTMVSDSNPLYNVKCQEEFNFKKTKMSYKAALCLSLNNIKTKKARTLLTSVASSIGIIGIALILSISNGFNKKIDEYEKGALSSFPIRIEKIVTSVSSNNSNKKEYPNTKKLYLYDENSNGVYLNKITNEYVDYISKIDKKYLSAISFERLNNYNLLYKKGNIYKKTQSNYLCFSELPKDGNSFIKENYDLLYGAYPNNSHELVLIVNNKNEIDKNILDFLLIDDDKVSFDNIVGKEFKIINNDDFYYENNGLFIKKEANDFMYNNSNNITLKIVGIVRGKKNNELSNIVDAFNTSKSKIGYFNELTLEVVEKNKNSKIVKTQENVNYVTFMGNISFDEAGYTKKEVLTYLGKDSIPLSINIYPKNFDGKNKILKSLDEYNEKNNEKILYNDYAKTISDLSSNIMGAISMVLVAFSSISLIVSSIMISIITYISVLERTKEIGILRSMGARKKDISRVFIAEVLIIGMLSGLIGVIITRLLLILVNQILYKLTSLKNVGILSIKHMCLIILISVLLTLLGGFIPSKIASKKDPVSAFKAE